MIFGLHVIREAVTGTTPPAEPRGNFDEFYQQTLFTIMLMAELRRARWSLLLITSRLTHMLALAHIRIYAQTHKRKLEATVRKAEQARIQKEKRERKNLKQTSEERKKHSNIYQTQTTPSSGFAAKDIHDLFRLPFSIRAEFFPDFKSKSESYVIIQD